MMPFTGLPRTLTRHDISLSPTRYGALFLILLAVMLAGSVNYNNNLGFMLVFLLGGMALVCVFHALGNMVGLTVISVTSSPVFAGDMAEFTVAIEPGARDRCALSIGLDSTISAWASLPREKRQTIQVQLMASKRGWLRPEPLAIQSLFPLGLFNTKTDLTAHAACLVYPKPVFGPLSMTGDGEHGNCDGTSGNQGADDFQGLIPYQPGHPIRHIAWKALSRGQGVFTKDFSGNPGIPVMIDFHALDHPDTEQRLSRMCGMVLRAAAMNLEFGLRLPGTSLIPARGEAHTLACLKALAMHGLAGGLA